VFNLPLQLLLVIFSYVPSWTEKLMQVFMSGDRNFVWFCVVGVQLNLIPNFMKTCSAALELSLWADGRTDVRELNFVSSLKRKRLDAFAVPCSGYFVLSLAILICHLLCSVTRSLASLSPTLFCHSQSC
jgi:hypothetical protein